MDCHDMEGSDLVVSEENIKRVFPTAEYHRLAGNGALPDDG